MLDFRDTIPITLRANGAVTCENQTVLIEADLAASTSHHVFTWRMIGEEKTILKEGNDPTLTVFEPGLYELEIADGNKLLGCKSRSRIYVNGSDQLPVAKIEIPDNYLSLYTQSIRLIATLSSAGQEYEYLWSTDTGEIISGINSLTPLINGFGKYTLTIKNVHSSCVVEKIIDLNPLTKIEFSEHNCHFAFLGQGQIPLQLYAYDRFGKPVELLWSLPDGDSILSIAIDVDKSGIYEAELMLGGASIYSQKLRIDESMLSIPKANIVEFNNQGCVSEDIRLSSLFSDFYDGDTFIWRNPNNEIISDQNNVYVNAQGWYSLGIISQYNGCQSTDTENVSIYSSSDFADAGESKVLYCEEGQVTLGENNADPGYAFKWYLKAGVDNVLVGETARLETNIEGLYLLEMHDSKNNCTTFDEVEVTSWLDEFTLDISATTLSDSCMDYTNVLSIKNINDYHNYALEWTLPNGDKSDKIIVPVLQSGKYRVKFTLLDSNCSFLDEVEIDLIPDFTVDYTFDDVNCNGGNDGYISIFPSGGIPPYHTEELAFHFTDLSVGVYQFEVFDDNNCVQTIEVPLTEPLPLDVTWSTNNNISASLEVIGGTPPYTFLWSDGAKTNTNFNLRTGETYTVSVIDANGCEEIANINYELKIEDNDLLLYPNPSKGLITLRHNQLDANQYDLELLDISGTLLRAYKEVCLPQKLNLDLTNLPAGVYFLNLTVADEKYTRRIVLLK